MKKWAKFYPYLSPAYDFLIFLYIYLDALFGYQVLENVLIINIFLCRIREIMFADKSNFFLSDNSIYNVCLQNLIKKGDQIIR